MTPLVPARFWSMVDTSAGLFACWPWQGKLTEKGYGRISVANRDRRASRIAWELTNGQPIPPGLLVLHDCDNPPCVNPAHLHLGTIADNNREMSERGRARNADAYKTHCKRGHPFAGPNLRIKPDGRRQCLTCYPLRLRLPREGQA